MGPRGVPQAVALHTRSGVQGSTEPDPGTWDLAGAAQGPVA